MDDFSTENIVNRLSKGIYWDGFYEQYWFFEPHEKMGINNDKIWVFMRHRVAGQWGGWLHDEDLNLGPAPALQSPARKTWKNGEIMKFSTLEDARLQFLWYVIVYTTFKHPETHKPISIDELHSMGYLLFNAT